MTAESFPGRTNACTDPPATEMAGYLSTLGKRLETDSVRPRETFSEHTVSASISLVGEHAHRQAVDESAWCVGRVNFAAPQPGEDHGSRLPSPGGNVNQAALDRFSGEPLLVGVRLLFPAHRPLEEGAKAAGSV